MADIKCSRCDRRYSSLRGRCPYCKTRRRKDGKRVADPENAKWKFIIGILLFAILIAAVVVLLVTSLKNAPAEPVEPSPPEFSESEGVDTVDSDPLPEISPEPETSPEPEPSPEPVIPTETVKITWNGSEKTDVSMATGDVLQFGVKTVPETTGDTPIWSSDNEDVFVVLQSGKVTAVGKGNANLTVTCGSASASCIIRVTK